MPIPSFDKLMRPVLALSARGTVTRQQATSAMSDQFQLTGDERAALIPSGASTVIANRTGWAMTFLTKARLIQKVAQKTYAATDLGNDFLERYPDGFSEKELRDVPGWESAWKSNKTNDQRSTKAVMSPEGAAPIELIESALESLQDEVRRQLMEAVLKQSPEFFERLVLDVLTSMGYGGSRPDAASHLGRSGDEGIDGRINQDRLGLDQILVQAKRYSPDRAIDRPTIQAFVGSLAGQGVNKGIFITTSYFTRDALEFVSRGINTKVVLIDGEKLLDLMIEHKIGVRAERQITLVDLDQNYFEEE
jgi:restriction system protein